MEEMKKAMDAEAEKMMNDEYEPSMRSRILRIAFTLVALGIVATGFVLFVGFVGFDIFGGESAAQAAADLLANYGIWIFVIFYALYITQAIFLNFIPGTITFFITFGYFLFGQNFWILVIVGIVCVLSSSMIVYTIGRFGGRKLLFWLFGKKHVESKLDWIQQKGPHIIPWLYLVPFMTGDLVCMLCGASKMKFRQFLTIIIIFRPIEIAIVSSYVPVLRFIAAYTTVFERFLIIGLIITSIIAIITYTQVLKLKRKENESNKVVKGVDVCCAKVVCANEKSIESVPENDPEITGVESIEVKTVT